MTKMLINVAACWLAVCATAAEAQEAAAAAAGPDAAPVLAVADDAGPPASSDIDPLRIAAAQRVMAILMPEESTGVIDAMIESTLASQTAILRNNEEFKAIRRANPAAAAVVDRFMANVGDVTRAVMIERLPQLRGANITAYARRMDVTVLTDLEQFLRTPSGQNFAANWTAANLDPAVINWTVEAQAAVQERMRPLLAEFMTELMQAATKTTDE